MTNTTVQVACCESCYTLDGSIVLPAVKLLDVLRAGEVVYSSGSGIIGNLISPAFTLYIFLGLAKTILILNVLLSSKF